jgi:mannose-6-phosphate isomerase-like protein (cupin superfamily)
MAEQPAKLNFLGIARTLSAERTNIEVARVGTSSVRLAVATGVYPWHRHPDSDELFLVLEGELVIEFMDGGNVTLGPMEAFRVPAGVVHQTRSALRTINLCFEAATARTEFINSNA